MCYVNLGLTVILLLLMVTEHAVFLITVLVYDILLCKQKRDIYVYTRILISLTTKYKQLRVKWVNQCNLLLIWASR